MCIIKILFRIVYIRRTFTANRKQNHSYQSIQATVPLLIPIIKLNLIFIHYTAGRTKATRTGRQIGQNRDTRTHPLYTYMHVLGGRESDVILSLSFVLRARERGGKTTKSNHSRWLPIFFMREFSSSVHTPRRVHVCI